MSRLKRWVSYTLPKRQSSRKCQVCEEWLEEESSLRVCESCRNYMETHIV